MKGLFITLEGPDGSGKSTILREIEKHFKKTDIEFITTREPGGTSIGEEIRNIILDAKNTELGDETEALLYAASRAQHIHQLIRPALAEGKLVLSDRFLLSSLAYQGVGRDLGIEEVKAINDFGTRGLEPDMILFFHIDPEETLKRKFEDSEGDRLEQEGSAFHKKVYEGYMSLVDKYPKNIKLIDARKTVEQVAEQAIRAIEEKLAEGGR